MKFLNNMKISTKLMSCFVFSLMLSVLISCFVYTNLDNKVIAVTLLLSVNIILMVIYWLFVSESVNKPIEEIKNVLGIMADNDFTTEMKGNYTGTMNELANNVIGLRSRLLSVQDVFEHVGIGETSRLEELEKIGKRSANDRLMPACVLAMKSMRDLISETGKLTDAAVNGDLNLRGDEKKFEGGYKEIIKGFNNTLNAVVEPINASRKVLANFVNNDFTLNMTGNYKGFYNDFAQAINDVQARLLAVQKIAGKVAKGDISELEHFKSIGKRSENDQLIPSFVAMMEEIQNLYIEVDRLTQATVAGELNTRGDADKFEGNYREIVLGINRLIDAFVAPMDEAKQVLGEMANNDFTASMTGTYNGALNQLKENVNELRGRLLGVQDAFEHVAKGDTSRLEEYEKIGKRSENDRLMPACTSALKSIHDLIHEAGILANAAIDGDLNVRGNEKKFEGGYQEIIKGFNKTIDVVVKPINEASAVMREMSKGNLTVSMDGDYKGDYAKIKNDLNSTIYSFNDVLNDINLTAQQVASGASQVSYSAQTLSQGSTEQASSIEELTASLEEISAQTKQNALNASQANELALAAKEGATDGNEQMKEMLKAMNDINESSANISKIIKVIDEIAFQTNILALNAAVEAARAGQHGKGFAVVAEEVRNLAARSANAAKETTALIENSIKKAVDGTKIASDTANALNKIVEGVTKSAALVGEIATASDEQASGIAQVNQGIMQVSQVVQTISATSEEGASASEELSSQAEILREMVSKFELKKGGAVLNNLNELNPEVLKMLGDMALKKQNYMDVSEPQAEFASAKPKIVLSDKEFGKY